MASMITLQDIISRYFAGINLDNIDGKGTSMYVQISSEILIGSYVAQTTAQTSKYPIVTSSYKIYYGSTLKVEGIDYSLNTDTGLLTLITFPTAGQAVTIAPYKHMANLKGYVDASISQVERDLDIVIEEEDFSEEVHDWLLADGNAWSHFQVHHMPVTDVSEVKYTYPHGTDIKIPDSWYKFKVTGEVNLVPSWGTLAGIFILPSGSYFPNLYAFPHIPGIVEITYTAGYPDGEVPADINHLIGLRTAVNILLVLSDLVLGTPGLSSQSLGIDGLSQSTGAMMPFKNRIATYLDEIEKLNSSIRNNLRGLQFAVA